MSSNLFPDPFAECRAHPNESTEPCPCCGHVREPLPAWVLSGAIFALAGKTYRIVGIGSTNRGSRANLHFHDEVSAEEIVEGAPPWRLPRAPCAVDDLADALARERALPRFGAAELRRALHVAPTSTSIERKVP